MDDLWNDIEDMINNDPPQNQPQNFWLQTDLSPDPVMPVMEMRQSHFGYLQDQISGLLTLHRLAKYDPAENPALYHGFATQLDHEVRTMATQNIVPVETYVDPKVPVPFQAPVEAFRGVLEVSDDLIDRSDAIAADPDRGYDAFAAACRQIARNIRFFLNEYKLMELPADEVQNFPPTRFFPSHPFGLRRYTRLHLKLVDDFNRLQRFFIGRPLEPSFKNVSAALQRADMNATAPDFIPVLREWSFLDNGTKFHQFAPPGPWMRVLRRFRDAISSFHHFAGGVLDPTPVLRFPTAVMLRNQGIGYLDDIMCSMEFCSINMKSMCEDMNPAAYNTWRQLFQIQLDRVKAVFDQFDLNTIAGMRLRPQLNQIGGLDQLPAVAETMKTLSTMAGFPEGLKTAMMGFHTNIFAFCLVHGAPIQGHPTQATLSFPAGLLLTATERTALDLMIGLNRLRRHIPAVKHQARMVINQAHPVANEIVRLSFAEPILDDELAPLVDQCYHQLTTATLFMNVNFNRDLLFYYRICMGNITFFMNRCLPHRLQPNGYPNQ